MSKLTVDDLPPEILWHTLQLAVLPEYMLDHSLSRGPSSAWCRNLRTKKAILMVCKAWNDVALPMLYQGVIIRRFGQFLALSKVLEDNPGRLAPIVRSMTVEGFVEDTFFDLFRERLELTYQICPGLSTLSCQLILPRTADIILVPAHSNITRLSLNGSAHYTTEILRQLCDTLLSLTVKLDVSWIEESNLKAFNLCFPKLEELRCLVDDDSPTESPVCSRKWTMPSLSTLTLDVDTYDLTSISTSICRKHGAKLKKLRIMASHATEINNHLQDVLNSCPELGDLYLSLASLPWGTIPSFSHPCLKRVDIGVPWSPTGPQNKYILTAFEFGQFDWDCPGLDRVRLVSKDLNYVKDLEVLMQVISRLDFQPPTDNPEAGISFENLCICHVPFNGQQVQWVHPLGDHSDHPPINRGLSLLLSTDELDEDDAYLYQSSDGTSSTYIFTDTDGDEEDLVAIFWELVEASGVPEFGDVLELFEDSLACDTHDTDSERVPWQEFVEPRISEGGVDYS
ncbi:hypothetical protein BDN72DRAFT_534181 [Pluteus cervinus]|uniref:Uncharacterized protein n=1 Tax=Pluteus cervinus TaxID=181527 RepID=A0ACD3AXQ0_9AGAR|nr:hypothetical protein BDN72DRAFT_534181 [Pluteus cervinus]